MLKNGVVSAHPNDPERTLVRYEGQVVALAPDWYGERGRWVITSYEESGRPHTSRTIGIAGNEGGVISPAPQDLPGNSISDYTTPESDANQGGTDALATTGRFARPQTHPAPTTKARPARSVDLRTDRPAPMEMPELVELARAINKGKCGNTQGMVLRQIGSASQVRRNLEGDMDYERVVQVPFQKPKSAERFPAGTLETPAPRVGTFVICRRNVDKEN